MWYEQFFNGLLVLLKHGRLNTHLDPYFVQSVIAENPLTGPDNVRLLLDVFTLPWTDRQQQHAFHTVEIAQSDLLAPVYNEKNSTDTHNHLKKLSTLSVLTDTKQFDPHKKIQHCFRTLTPTLIQAMASERWCSDQTHWEHAIYARSVMHAPHKMDPMTLEWLQTRVAVKHDKNTLQAMTDTLHQEGQQEIESWLSKIKIKWDDYQRAGEQDGTLILSDTLAQKIAILMGETQGASLGFDSEAKLITWLEEVDTVLALCKKKDFDIPNNFSDIYHHFQVQNYTEEYTFSRSLVALASCILLIQPLYSVLLKCQNKPQCWLYSPKRDISYSSCDDLLSNCFSKMRHLKTDQTQSQDTPQSLTDTSLDRPVSLESDDNAYIEASFSTDYDNLDNTLLNEEEENDDDDEIESLFTNPNKI